MGVDVEVATVTVAETVWFADRLTLLGLVTDGPGGDIAVVNDTVPANPLTLVMVRVVVADDPWTTLRVVGFAEIVKSGDVLVEKIAVWTVSGTEVGVPFTIVTHVPPDTLLCEQPV